MTDDTLNPSPSTSSTPAPGDDLSAGGGASRMPRTLDELKKLDGDAAPAAAANTGSAESPRPFSDLSRRIMASWGKLWAAGVQVFSGAKVKPEIEHAELVGESLLACARHGSTGFSPAAEARIDLGFSAGLVVVDVLLKRLESGIEKRREADKNA